MSRFFALITREYWEWRKVIFGTLGVFSFLLLLTLIPLNRLSNEIESWGNRNNLDDISYQSKIEDLNLSQQDKEQLSKLLDGMDIDHSKSFFDQQSQTLKEALSESPMVIIKPYGIGILSGFAMIQLFVLFISLFYYSDSLYKERINDSTFYFRSLPINDHWIILSKLKAGGVGIIGLTGIMLLTLLIYAHLAMMTVSWDIWSIISSALIQINMIDLFFDLILYQAIALIWTSPLILFLMLISSIVKNRPLIIGIGLPILASITLTVILGDNALVNQVGDIFGATAKMITEQSLITEVTITSTNGVDILDSFWGYLFSVRTMGSLIVSGLMYIATWKMYRKNMTTN